MANKLLLIEDVESLGRSGDIVTVKPGYARNYLLPKGIARIADKGTLRMQAKLQEERRKQAAADLAEAQAIAEKVNGKAYEVEVKVDHEGHMYGSVAVADVVRLVQENEQVELDKHWVKLEHPIKTTGIHKVPLRLKEDVEAEVILKVFAEGAPLPTDEAEEAEAEAEEVSEEFAE